MYSDIPCWHGAPVQTLIKLDTFTLIATYADHLDRHHFFVCVQRCQVCAFVFLCV